MDMEERKMITRDARSYRVLSLICMSGECSEEALRILLPQDNYRQKLLYKMISDKLITRYQKDGVYGYRLAKKGKDYLLLMDKERFGFFLLDGADFSMRRPILRYRLRQHRISETLAMMESAVEIYRDRKELIFEEYTEQAFQQSAFFVAREVKAQKDLTRKIVSSKMTGVWVNQEEASICYNMANNLPEWHENLENRTEILIRSMLRKEGVEHLDALIFGNDMSAAAKILSDGNMQRQLMVSSFERFCFIPMDRNGLLLLEMLKDKNAYEDLCCILTEDFIFSEEENQVINDGYNNDGKPVLICVDCDLKRLVQFISQLDFIGQTGEVICFDFQKEVVKEYCGKNAKVAAVDFEKFQENFIVQ